MAADLGVAVGLGRRASPAEVAGGRQRDLRLRCSRGRDARRREYTTRLASPAISGRPAIGFLPIAIGVAILRYRLYEIDRLVSRTLAYAVLTAVLVGTFAGIVLLTTRVLPFSSPVAVAASTLAVAALFNPLRTRVQRLVDRRFNRARYDRDALVAAFGAKLRDAVDSETVSPNSPARPRTPSSRCTSRSGFLRSSPLDELPDLGLGGGVLADLGERCDRATSAAPSPRRAGRAPAGDRPRCSRVPPRGGGRRPRRRARALLR